MNGAEGLFGMTATMSSDPSPEIPDGMRQDASELIAGLEAIGARGVVFPLHEPDDGYTAANDAVLAAAAGSGGRLVAFFGQHEHRRLTLASAQLDLLDGFIGRDHLDLRGSLAETHARAHQRAQPSDVQQRFEQLARERGIDTSAWHPVWNEGEIELAAELRRQAETDCGVAAPRNPAQTRLTRRRRTSRR